MSREDVTAVRDALDALGAFGLLSALGIDFKREGRAARFPCAWHSEKTPSATLRIGPEGSLQAHCHGACGRSWDALSLVAAVRGHDVRSDFRRVLQEGADLAGISLSADLGAGSAGFRASTSRSQPKTPPPTSVPAYPADAFELWGRCTPVDRDAEVSAYLAGRALDAGAVARLDLARVLPSGELPQIPRWCRGPSGSWETSGHRLVVPCFDAYGVVRSLRASLVQPVTVTPCPKRLAPAGHTSTGLVFCNPSAAVMLSNPSGAAEDMLAAFSEVRVLVVEGEPDFLAASVAWPTWPIVGVYSGSWSAEIAARIPDGARVVVRTHADDAGEKYASGIASSLATRCTLERAAP